MLYSQDYFLEKEISIDASIIQVDKLGNLYIVSDFSLKKYDDKGVLLFEYEDFSHGHISHIDVTDPLKVLLFHQDFLYIKVLDKTLSLMTEFDLSSIGLYTISSIAHSRDDRFWIYDISTAQLKKINENGEVFNESESFFQLFDEEVIPIYMIEQEGSLFCISDKGIIYIFDEFGTYLKPLTIGSLDFFQVIQNKIIYKNNGVLYSYHLKTMVREEMDVSDIKEAFQVVLAKDRIYVRTEEKVQLYFTQ